MRVIPLSEFGLMTTTEVCAAKGWSAKAVQNYVHAGLIPALVLGSGRSARFLLRKTDVDAFTPPTRGPKVGTKYKPRKGREKGPSPIPSLEAATEEPAGERKPKAG